jgi:flagellar basal-body rod protein FlgG
VLRILWSSKSAMAAQQEKIDSISNNIANINTEGYKRVDVNFKDLVYETLNRKGYPVNEKNSTSSYNGTGVKTSEWLRDDKQGNLTETSVTTDLAIDGEGYFEVILPVKDDNGNYKKAYTRGGSFNIDSEGNLTDKNGNKINIIFNKNIPDKDRKFTSENLKIDYKGNVYKSDNNSMILVGKLNVYNVNGDNSLKSIGDNLFIVNTENINGLEVPVEVPYLVEDSNIMQGMIELSNVDLSKEMTDMIVAQRAFELSSKAMKIADEMWGMANNLRSR